MRKTQVQKRRMQASFTIEAAVIVPLILFVFCAVITLSFELHENVKQEAAEREALTIDTMKEVRQQDIVLYIMGEENGDSL